MHFPENGKPYVTYTCECGLTHRTPALATTDECSGASCNAVNNPSAALFELLIMHFPHLHPPKKKARAKAKAAAKAKPDVHPLPPDRGRAA